ncbi:hypothetical protein [Streptomyces malaysiensis]|uniref:Uncharacterized protein n=1 Tax=Streptomyces malaysiensis subsp. samsunensis TaxID=459658 RepID=A0A9X2LZ28_STRMQ|nr:hypothetical protein [Streptomyces samsunensis]MCQ8832148.1 hypothetical protein [Streptomyces samsunensis]
MLVGEGVTLGFGGPMYHVEAVTDEQADAMCAVYPRLDMIRSHEECTPQREDFVPDQDGTFLQLVPLGRLRLPHPRLSNNNWKRLNDHPHCRDPRGLRSLRKTVSAFADFGCSAAVRSHGHLSIAGTVGRRADGTIPDDIRHLPGFSKIKARLIDPLYPTWSLIGVSGLANPGLLVEIRATAAYPDAA